MIHNTSTLAAMAAYIYMANNLGKPAVSGDGGKATTPVSNADEIRDALTNSEKPEVNLAVNEDLTITESSIQIPDGKTVTLNLADGVKVTAAETLTGADTDAVFVVSNGATLIIDGNGTIEASDKYCPIKLTSKSTYDATKTAKVVINNGTFIGDSAAIAGNGKRSNAEVEINGGTFKTMALDGAAIFNPQGTTKITINDGEFEGAMCVVLKSGEMEINGGNFHATGAAGTYKYNGNGWENTGDCVEVDNCYYPGGAPSISINGGTFTSDNGSAFSSYNGFVGADKKSADGVIHTEAAPRITRFVDRDKVNVTEAKASSEDVYK